MRIPLSRIAHARSGDKGDLANIGVIAREPRYYPILLRELTADRVRAFFPDWVRGPATRYELANLHALNFVLEQALDGGGTMSLRLDAQGKTFASKLLTMEIDVEPTEIGA